MPGYAPHALFYRLRAPHAATVCPPMTASGRRFGLQLGYGGWGETGANCAKLALISHHTPVAALSPPPSASICYMPGFAPHAHFLSPTGSPCGYGVRLLCLPSLPPNPHPPPTPALPGGNQRNRANEGGHGACNHSAAARFLKMPFSFISAIWLSGLQPYRGELSSGQSIGLISQRGSASLATL